MSKLSGFTLFIFGAGVGSAVAWYYAKKKYEQIAQEEIDSVKEAFAKREEKVEPPADVKKKAAKAKDKTSVVELAAKVREHGYTNYSNIDGIDDDDGRPKKKGGKKAVVKKPYVISPEEFGEVDGYEKISLTYYADQVLADDGDELVEDIDNVVGFDSLNTFGQYEDDSVFVRNDRLKCDYEILLDQRTYMDVVKMKPPHQVEG